MTAPKETREAWEVKYDEETFGEGKDEHDKRMVELCILADRAEQREKVNALTKYEFDKLPGVRFVLLSEVIRILERTET